MIESQTGKKERKKVNSEGNDFYDWRVICCIDRQREKRERKKRLFTTSFYDLNSPFQLVSTGRLVRLDREILLFFRFPFYDEDMDTRSFDQIWAFF